jgi:2-polyprenyl-6-methoxyphenol hydroxylase-like FAD-dependent oxidoreductase
MYVATLPLPDERADPFAVLLYNSPGRAISIHPARNRALCALIFRHPQVAQLDHRDQAQHRRILSDTYRGVGWRGQELIDKAMVSDELYFDAVSRVALPGWSRSRVALVGDAASCVSLFGNGSSLAIAGARVLAEELAATTEHKVAFARYEERHRRAVTPWQRNTWLAAAQIVPRTRAGIMARNVAMRLLSAMSRMRRSQRGG